LNWLDLIFVGIIVWFTATATYSGLIREVVTIGAAILGVVVAGMRYDEFADTLTFIDNSRLAHIVAFGIIFGAIMLAGQTVAFFLRRIAGLLMLGWLDRAGGAAVGFLKGSIIVEIFLIVVTTYPYFGLEDVIRDSPVASFYLEFIPVLVRLLPQEFHDAVEHFQTFN
jgi:membrane protein required for colicin V production